LAFGCLLALMIESDKAKAQLRRWGGWLFTAGAGIYVGLGLNFKPVHWVPGANFKLFDTVGYSLIAFASCSFIAHLVLKPQSLASRILSFGPLAWLGRISYGVYLYHELLMTLVMRLFQRLFHTTSPRLAFIFDFPLTLFVCWLSFKYYEQPIMAWGRRRTKRYGEKTMPEVSCLATSADSAEAAG
jgi:peptidoglycan/LPS O-acetylase OafA/YrhL